MHVDLLQLMYLFKANILSAGSRDPVVVIPDDHDEQMPGSLDMPLPPSVENKCLGKDIMHCYTIQTVICTAQWLSRADSLMSTSNSNKRIIDFRN